MLKPKTLKLDANIWASTESGIVYEFTDRQYSRTKPHERSYGGRKVIMWGSDNMLPYYNRDLLANNDIKQKLVNTDVALTAGQQLTPYQIVDKDGNGTRDKKWIVDPKVEKLIDELYLNEFYTDTLQDLKENGNSWPEFLLNNGRSKITSVQSLDAVDCRLESPGKGRPVDTLLVADWKYLHLRSEDITAIPLLDSRRPQIIRGQGPMKVAMHVKKHYSGQPYYSLVEWHGTKIWTRISDLIPQYHESGLNKNYGWRLHVQVPWSYLEDRIAKLVTASDGTLSEEQAMVKVKKEIQSQIDTASAGVKNNGKPLYSWIMDNMGTATEWKVTEIKSDRGDDSYLKLLDVADRKHMNGHGINPILAGQQATGMLGSGSEILNLVNYHTKFLTPETRRIAMSPINVILKTNLPGKWAEGIRIGVEDIEMATQDKAPGGTVVVTDQTQKDDPI